MVGTKSELIQGCGKCQHMDRIHVHLQRHAHILVSLSLSLPLLVVRDADSALSEEREKGSPRSVSRLPPRAFESSGKWPSSPLFSSHLPFMESCDVNSRNGAIPIGGTSNFTKSAIPVRNVFI